MAKITGELKEMAPVAEYSPKSTLASRNTPSRLPNNVKSFFIEMR